MNKGKSINIGGKDYPCYMTMGAWLHFKKLTGKELNEADGGVVDTLNLIWCLVAGALGAEGKKMTLSVQSLADKLTPEEFGRWSLEQSKATDGNADSSVDDEKKSD